MNENLRSVAGEGFSIVALRLLLALPPAPIDCIICDPMYENETSPQPKTELPA